MSFILNPSNLLEQVTHPGTEQRGRGQSPLSETADNLPVLQNNRNNFFQHFEHDFVYFDLN